MYLANRNVSTLAKLAKVIFVLEGSQLAIKQSHNLLGKPPTHTLCYQLLVINHLQINADEFNIQTN